MHFVKKWSVLCVVLSFLGSPLRKKTQLRKVKRTLDIEERMLFHGTGHSNIQAICTFNFDWRLTGSHGDVYGKGRPFCVVVMQHHEQIHCTSFGLYFDISFNLPFPAGSYFARDAKYSSKFCHTTGKHNTTLQRHGLAPPIFASEPPYKTMFLARVLVGEYTVGHPMYCRPPSKDASFTNFYDSCVDDMANPKIYVIFDSNQIYPEYLIEFYWSQRQEDMYFFFSLSNMEIMWMQKQMTGGCSGNLLFRSDPVPNWSMSHLKCLWGKRKRQSRLCVQSLHCTVYTKRPLWFERFCDVKKEKKCWVEITICGNFVLTAESLLARSIYVHSCLIAACRL